MEKQSENRDEKNIIFKITYLREYLELRIQISQDDKSNINMFHKNIFKKFGTPHPNTTTF